MADETRDDRSLLERALSVITEVKAGEGVSALLLTLNVFLLLTAYYFIKPVREALILVMEGGAEYKAYMSGAIAVALLLAVPAYARVAARLPRNRLVVGVTLFFVSHLVLFYFASSIESTRKYLGLVFYLWVGIFNMMVVAQFWAFANDVYKEEQGKRLFALIGLGASVGAAAGSYIAGLLLDVLGTEQMLLVAGAFLVACALLTQVVHKRETGEHAASAPSSDPKSKGDDKDSPPKKTAGAFAMVFRHRYLLLLAMFSLIFTLVNSNGEYMLGKLIKDAAVEAASAGEITGDDAIGTYIGQQYADFFLWVNVLGVVIQMFLVSRIVKYGGLRVAFFVLPVIAMGDAIAVALFPILAVIRVGKTAENAVDYSVNNTVRNMLWLPTTREMKYMAKQAVDTFFVRMGDVGSALIVFVAAGLLGMAVRGFALINIVLVVIWLWLARAILVEQEVLKKMKAEGKLDDS